MAKVSPDDRVFMLIGQIFGDTFGTSIGPEKNYHVNGPVWLI
jgi:hypothetical protein